MKSCAQTSANSERIVMVQGRIDRAKTGLGSCASLKDKFDNLQAEHRDDDREIIVIE